MVRHERSDPARTRERIVPDVMHECALLYDCGSALQRHYQRRRLRRVERHQLGCSHCAERDERVVVGFVVSEPDVLYGGWRRRNATWRGPALCRTRESDCIPVERVVVVRTLDAERSRGIPRGCELHEYDQL